MISQLLFLSRADQGRQPIHRERLDLSELTEMIVEEQQMLADGAGRGIRIESRISPGVEADADETLYIRMVSNLLSNAVRYSHDGGKVEVVLEVRDGEVRGRVKDHGVGIAAEDLPRIWERFYRADSSCPAYGNGSTGRTAPGRRPAIPGWGFPWCGGSRMPTAAMCRWPAKPGRAVNLPFIFRRGKKMKKIKKSYFL